MSEDPEPEKKFEIDQLVDVAFRRCYGIPDKPGGVGRIKSVDDNNKYSVTYVLGGIEHMVDATHISLVVPLGTRIRKKADTFTITESVSHKPKRKLEDSQAKMKAKSAPKKVKASDSNQIEDYDEYNDRFTPLLNEGSNSYTIPITHLPEEEQPPEVSDEVYFLATCVMRELNQINNELNEGYAEADTVKTRLQSVAAHFEGSEGGIVITDEIFTEALQYLQEVNRIMQVQEEKLLLYII